MLCRANEVLTNERGFFPVSGMQKSGYRIVITKSYVCYLFDYAYILPLGGESVRCCTR